MGLEPTTCGLKERSSRQGWPSPDSVTCADALSRALGPRQSTEFRVTNDVMHLSSPDGRALVQLVTRDATAPVDSAVSAPRSTIQPLELGRAVQDRRTTHSSPNRVLDWVEVAGAQRSEAIRIVGVPRILLVLQVRAVGRHHPAEPAQAGFGRAGELAGAVDGDQPEGGSVAAPLVVVQQ